MDYATVLLAGRVAQGLAARGRVKIEGSEDDFKKAYQLAGYLCGSDDEVDVLMDLLNIRARNELRQDFNWSKVEALARELLARKRLNYDEVRGLYQQPG